MLSASSILALPVPRRAYSCTPLHKGGMLTRERLAWARFLESLESFSVKLSEGRWSEEDFAKHTGDLARTLDPLDRVPKGMGEVSFEMPYTFRWIETTPHFDIVLLKLKKGFPIPPHNHPSTTGVALVISGSTCITTYELEDALHEVKRSALRVVKMSEFRAWDVSTLTSTRDNIHSVEALDDFCHIIDIFTPPKNFLKATIYPGLKNVGRCQ